MELKKRGPKVKWTTKRVKVLAKNIARYAAEAFDRVGEMKGLAFVGPEMPTLADCFRKNRISSSTVHELQKEHQNLANAIKKVKDVQEHLLLNYALRGGYASTFAIFAAKNMLGWRDEKQGPLVDQSRHTHFTVVMESDGNGSAGSDRKINAKTELGVSLTDEA